MQHADAGYNKPMGVSVLCFRLYMYMDTVRMGCVGGRKVEASRPRAVNRARTFVVQLSIFGPLHIVKGLQNYFQEILQAPEPPVAEK